MILTSLGVKIAGIMFRSDLLVLVNHKIPHVRPVVGPDSIVINHRQLNQMVLLEIWLIWVPVE
jgi:hypothetical protein